MRQANNACDLAIYFCFHQIIIIQSRLGWFRTIVWTVEDTTEARSNPKLRKIRKKYAVDEDYYWSPVDPFSTRSFFSVSIDNPSISVQCCPLHGWGKIQQYNTCMQYKKSLPSQSGNWKVGLPILRLSHFQSLSCIDINICKCHSLKMNLWVICKTSNNLCLSFCMVKWHITFLRF